MHIKTMSKQVNRLTVTNRYGQFVAYIEVVGFMAHWQELARLGYKVEVQKQAM
jgi:hypothetical protein